MANFDNIHELIDETIYPNSAGEITASEHNAMLHDVVDGINEAIEPLENDGYLYAGVVTPTSAAPTATGKVFVLASTAGTYTNFGNLVVNEGEVAILKYNGTAWSKDVTGIGKPVTISQNTQTGGYDLALNAVVIKAINAGYQFMGIATPTTNPGTPDQRVFYIANGKGTYANFGGIVVNEDDVVILYWDSQWNKIATGIASQINLEDATIISKEFVSFDVQNGGQITFDPITLSEDGDVLEIEVLPQVDNLNAYAMTIGGYGPNQYGVGVANDRYTAFADNTEVQSQPFYNARWYPTERAIRYLTIKYEGGQVKMYTARTINPVATYQAQPITLHGIGNLNNPSYRWYGTIYKFVYTHNGVSKNIDQFDGLTFNENVIMNTETETVKERVLTNTGNINIQSSKIKYLTDNILGEIARKSEVATTHILTESGILDVETQSVPTKIYGKNRIDINNVTIHNNWAASNMFATVSDNGIAIDCSTLIDSRLHSNLYASIKYTAEFSGNLYLGCIIKLLQGSPLYSTLGVYTQRDGNYVIGSNTSPAAVSGTGQMKICIPVVAGDIVTICFYGNKSRNVEARSVIKYTNVMVAYYDFEKYEPFIGTITDNVDLSLIEQGNIIEFVNESQLTYSYIPEKKTINCVCMGDSITGMFTYKTDYPSIISSHSNINAINCGFSGSTIADHPSATNRPFSINRLADAIVTGDWSTQDAKVEAAGGLYPEHLANLKSVDFKNIDLLTIFAGTNDWAFNIIAASSDDTSATDKQHSNIEDAVKYSINRILTAYPNLKILVITPMWRNRGGTDSTSTRQDSNVTPNSNGVFLYEVADIIGDAAKTQNTPSYPLYWVLGINSITADYYLGDGTHPNYTLRRIFAQKFTEWINGNLLTNE